MEYKVTLRRPWVLPAALCGVGLLGVIHGMTRDNDVSFVAGLLLFIGGYLMIRKALKASIRDKSRS